ncbi:MAG: hypothetical protein JW781_05395 [Deltaproteobacteria bacterium]|nr:hypothetical protein [Candidatus Anaeroferrophillacea bacterium]
MIGALDAAGFHDGENLVIDQFFMDTKKTWNTPEQIAERGRQARERPQTFRPDLVVTIDDNATRTAMLPLAGGDIPVVFSGMNGQPEDYNREKKFMESREKPGGNVTGVYEKLHFGDALDVMHAINGLHRVAVILDATPTGNALRRQIEAEASLADAPVTAVCRQVGEFEAFKRAILETNNDPEIGATYPVVGSLKTADGRTVTTDEIFSWLFTYAKKPEMTINYYFSQRGMFGGAAVDFHAMGEQAGKMTPPSSPVPRPATFPSPTSGNRHWYATWSGRGSSVSKSPWTS